MARDRISTLSYEPDADGMTELVDLLVLVAQADGEVDHLEANAIHSLISTLRRDVLQKHLSEAIVRQSAMRMKQEGARAAVTRIGRRLGQLGKMEDALGMGRDVAESSKKMSELEWTILVMAGRAAGLEPDRLRQLLGSKPA